MVYSALIALALSLASLAVSSLSKSARVAGLGFFGLLMGLEAIHNILRQAFDRPEAAVLSIMTDLQAIGHALFGITARRLLMPWPWAAAALVVIALGCLAILRSRVRAVEIVR